eukprot:scpid56478/ scgid20707/ 
MTLPLMLQHIPMKRRFWSAHTPTDMEGHWEYEVRGTWRIIGDRFPDYEDKKYFEYFRVDVTTFGQLYEMFGRRMQKQTTRLTTTICGKKRMAISLEWTAHCPPYHKLATEYHIGTSAVHSIIQDGMEAFLPLVQQVCKFPSAVELLVDQTMEDFASLCHLPGVAGALDGTFMHILKPIEHGDACYCYKGYPAIVLLLCVDARGIIAYINAGRAGCMGDAYTWNTCKLRQDIDNGTLLPAGASINVLHRDVHPCLVTDSAVASSSALMKCYDGNGLNPVQKDFNHCVIRTRRVVENAIGRVERPLDYFGPQFHS